jgi:hypothetical protein
MENRGLLCRYDYRYIDYYGNYRRCFIMRYRWNKKKFAVNIMNAAAVLGSAYILGLIILFWYMGMSAI